MSYLQSIYDSIYVPSLLTHVLYGGYAVLFAIFMYIMRCKNGITQRVHQVAIISLFALATVGFIFSSIEENMQVKLKSGPGLESFKDWFNPYLISQTVLFGIYTLANVIADFILIHRCYKLWKSKKRVIAFPVFISVVNNGLALVRMIFQAIWAKDMITDDFETLDSDTLSSIGKLGPDFLISFLAVNLFANLLIPFMIAGRIWWIGRQASKFIGRRKNSLTRRSITAICLESGIIYPVLLIPTLAVYVPIYTSTASFNFLGDLIPMLTQVVGIAPTFIIVRVALGISIENVQDTAASWDNEGDLEDDASTGASV
ncbi:hypothetical protein D9758_009872 [Tetrapyrgos nigripes]|uniref:Uncharacterized protein n=1 Tax=Tetrapyrgos nigripes TaxID=182062 RepID=A0A8H5GN44_9AGAR|nr:hypothetical protein D9758_009872 [Tetrapyrgos nigripes]